MYLSSLGSELYLMKMYSWCLEVIHAILPREEQRVAHDHVDIEGEFEEEVLLH